MKHFKCRKTSTQKSPFSTVNFRTHVARCTGAPKSAKLPSGGMKPIDMFFKRVTPRLGATQAGMVPTLSPCLGLDEKTYPRVGAYLDRTGAYGGGASSITRIAFELYGKAYKQLSSARKDRVRVLQSHEWTWRNDHNAGRVFASKCLKLVSSVGPESKESTRPCQECYSVLTSKKFIVASKVAKPSDENYKYVNYGYRNQRLAVLYGRCLQLREFYEGEVIHTSTKYSSLDSLNQIDRISTLCH